MPGVIPIHDMNLADWAAVLLAPVTIAGAVVAGLAWRTSIGVRKDQAEAEKDRRHREMRPMLDVAADLRFGSDTGILTVKLTGPREMERYDWIRVQMRNDKERKFPGAHRGYSEEEWQRQVWGPFRFRPGVDGAGEHGRTAELGGRAVTDAWLFAIERTTPPS